MQRAKEHTLILCMVQPNPSWGVRHQLVLLSEGPHVECSISGAVFGRLMALAKYKVHMMPCDVQVAWVYTLFMATLMGLLVGVTQRILGSPGDLPEVVHQIHTSGRIDVSQAPSMFVCSAFSIAAGTFPHSPYPGCIMPPTTCILSAKPSRACQPRVYRRRHSQHHTCLIMSRVNSYLIKHGPSLLARSEHQSHVAFHDLK